MYLNETWWTKYKAPSILVYPHKGANAGILSIFYNIMSNKRKTGENTATQAAVIL